MGESDMGLCINDYLWGKCEITQAAHDVTATLGGGPTGKLFLVPGSIKPGEIARILREGYDVGLLNDGFQQLVSGLKLDVLVIDTHPGLNEETLLSIAISDALIIILRPDQQDYQGTSVTVQVARRLSVPSLLLLVNKCPTSFQAEAVKKRVEEAYKAEVVAVLPHSDEMMTLASNGVFVMKFPNNAITQDLKRVVARLMA
jgi:MinD-like ATPase involved in chromosome partitioning or flagellar assembly